MEADEGLTTVSVGLPHLCCVDEMKSETRRGLTVGLDCSVGRGQVPAPVLASSHRSPTALLLSCLSPHCFTAASLLNTLLQGLVWSQATLTQAI